VNATFDAVTAGLFLLFVFPGLISTTVYRLIMPARALEWGNAVVQGLFYSGVNFILSLPILYWLVLGYDPVQDAGRYIIAAFLVLLVTPLAWPIALVAIFKSKAVAKRIQIPYPTAWDAFFDPRKPAFLLIHLTNGGLLGGYWGGNSYAGSYPNDGDIYLEAVYRVDAVGNFGDPVRNTLGVLLRKDQYTYIEVFAVPKVEVKSDGKERPE
jgi:hypothetical protein